GGEDYYDEGDEGDEGGFNDGAPEVLMAAAEHVKAGARVRFQDGDFMGAAKGYLEAATILETLCHAPAGSATSVSYTATRTRVAWLCSAAVSGFKAAAAAPAAGEAYGLVVAACNSALETSGGWCAK
ncbi:unnamed protein product, partial [Discosporangium mesarthrocarpum]